MNSAGLYGVCLDLHRGAGQWDCHREVVALVGSHDFSFDGQVLRGGKWRVFVGGGGPSWGPGWSPKGSGLFWGPPMGGRWSLLGTTLGRVRVRSLRNLVRKNWVQLMPYLAGGCAFAGGEVVAFVRRWRAVITLDLLRLQAAARSRVLALAVRVASRRRASSRKARRSVGLTLGARSAITFKFDFR